MQPLDLELKIPLCVDLDGTLVQEDTFILGMNQYLNKNYLRIFTVLRWCFPVFNREKLKHALAQNHFLDYQQLNFINPVVNLIKHEKMRKRKIYLVTGSNNAYANLIAKQCKYFDDVFASDRTINLISHQKAKFLEKKFGKQQFAYIGNSKSDLAVWEKSCLAILSPLTPIKIANKIHKMHKNVLSL